ncbi:unnamed protein product [Pipistrellus nathusii]|uniref:Uncharacterized protein n=1 Tax=Pipistrellus nathusii TaxID=59473 RepID=A0ABP0A7M7_PIPNA
MRTGKEDPLVVHFRHCTSGLAECSPIGSPRALCPVLGPGGSCFPRTRGKQQVVPAKSPPGPREGYILGFFFLFYKRDPSPHRTHLLCCGLTCTIGDALLGSL